MRAYLLNLWDSARATYWVVPSLCCFAALALAWIVPKVDASVMGAGWEGPDWIHTTTATARTTLSATAGAMIAATGTVFSVTIVTLSLTSQQFGPRLLRRFMSDLTTQYTLGIFLATGFYCLIGLRSVKSYDEEVAALHLSAIVGVALAAASMMTLIVFINHVTLTIQAPHIVASVGKDLDEAIDRIFPESRASTEDPDGLGARPPDEILSVHSQIEGYIQSVSIESLTGLASKHDLVIQLLVRPGNFVSRSALLADVWVSAASEPPDRKELENEINRTLIVGIRRTPRQDVGCAAGELVEVAVRSLSPGINDPFTAMNCVDRLGASLARLAERPVPSPYRRDEQGRIRIIENNESFESLLDASFNQIRQYGRGSVAVSIRILESLASVAVRAHGADRKEAIRRQAHMILRGAKSIPEENDYRDVEASFQLTLAALDARKE